MARSKKHPGKSPAQQVQIARLVAEAVTLRGEGLTYEAIGKRQGCGKRTAQRRCERGLLRMVQEPAERTLKLELERLDRMLEGLVKKGAFKGNVAAVMAAVKVMDRRAKLLGLDAPEKHEHSGAVSVGPTILIPPERPDDVAADPASGRLAPEPGAPN